MAGGVGANAYYLHSQNKDDGDSVYTSGIAPQGFTSISNVYLHFWTSNTDELDWKFSFSIAGNDEAYDVHQVVDVDMTAGGFTPTAYDSYKVSWFNETGSNDFEDLINAGDSFGIQFKQNGAANTYIFGASIVWVF
jgi:hypothetical protein